MEGISYVGYHVAHELKDCSPYEMKMAVSPAFCPFLKRIYHPLRRMVG